MVSRDNCDETSEIDVGNLSIWPYKLLSPKSNSFESLLLVGTEPELTSAKQLLEADGRCRVLSLFEISPGCIEALSSLSNKLAEDSDIPIVVSSSSELTTISLIESTVEKPFLFRESLPDISHNLAILDDELSRDVLKQQQRMLDNNFYIEGFSSEAGFQHDHKKVNAVRGERILSVGPYYGNLLKSFSISAEKEFTCHCLEANPFVFAQLCINLVHWKLHRNVVPVCAGAWSESGMVAFASDGHTGGGDIVDLDLVSAEQPLELAIYAYSIDDYVNQTGYVPTLIESGRIGIAGPVIHGAKETIIHNKPKLIILDHPDSQIPVLLKKWVPEYKVYYSESGRVKYGTFFFTI